MKRTLKFPTLLSAVVLFSILGFARPARALAPGDVAILEYDCEAVGTAADAKQWSLLFLADVPADTTLYFSNGNWASNTQVPTSKIIGWSAPTDSPAGTIITYWGNSAATGPGSVSMTAAAGGSGTVGALYGTCTNVAGTAPLGMSNSAPFTLSVFTGTTTTPVALTALLDGGTWNTTAPLPQGLTDAFNAGTTTASAWSLAAADYQHAGQYDCLDVNDSEATLDNDINAENQTTLTHWTTGTTVTGLDPCGAYTIQAGSSSPTDSPSASPTNTDSPEESPTPTFTASPTLNGTLTESPTSTASPTAAPTLAVGSVAIVAFDSSSSGSSPKQFSMVFLVDVPANTPLYFSNAVWASSSAPSATGKVVEWTNSVDSPAGTVLSYFGGTATNTPGSASIGTITQVQGTLELGFSSSLLNLSVFQGGLASPQAITAMIDGAAWGGSNPLPDGLADGSTAWTLSAYAGGGYYDCEDTNDSMANLDNAINADNGGAGLANWNVAPAGGYSSNYFCGFYGTPGPSQTSSPSASPTVSASASASGSPTASPTLTVSPLETATPTFTASPTLTDSPFETATPTSTNSPDESPTPTFSASRTATASPSASPTQAVAGTLLSQGDVMIVALAGASKSAAGKQIAFEFMVNIAATTSIGICNSNWASGAFSGGAHYVVWTADQAYPAGTVVTYGRPACGNTNCITADKGIISEGGNLTDGIGFSQPKLLTVFQGSSANPVLLNAVLMGATWGANVDGSVAAAAVPANGNGALVDGQTAVQFATFPDWAGYNCAVASGSEAGQDAAMDADPLALPTNWTISDSDTTDTLASFSPPWEPCSLRVGVGGNYGYTPPQPPKPLVGPVPAHAGQPIHLIPAEDASSSQFWVFSLTGRLVSKLSFGSAPAGDGSWAWSTQNMAPGVYRLKSKVVYADGSTYEGWLNLAVVP